MGSQPEAPGVLYGWAMIWTLLGIFAGGMALNLTPCVYPLIPITISYFGGRDDRRQLIGHGFCYIGGLSITNSILGVVAALTGGLMGAVLQNPLVLAFVAVILILLATSLFGLWELRLSSGLMQAASRPYTGYLGTLFMGLTMGVVAAPCIGPFVLGLLTWVAFSLPLMLVKSTAVMLGGGGPAASSAAPQPAELFLLPQYFLDDTGERTALQENIDEPGPGDVHVIDLARFRHLVDDQFSQLSRSHAGLLGQHHGNVRRELTVFR